MRTVHHNQLDVRVGSDTRLGRIKKKTVMASQTLEYNPSIAIRKIEKEGSLETTSGTDLYGRLVRIGGYDCDRAKTMAKNHVGWLGGYQRTHLNHLVLV